ncbi:hypothetical protein [Stieleria mannarensis]|uniref:hypothetical protein n=1 Tax=Stieleria mannarensis TaxID=2755585 RepID=UPI001600DD77|nr:hypothetical protein [Rhodopirellula sp. JC639]
MKRLLSKMLIASVSIMALVGCNSSAPSTSVETRSEQEIQQEMENYEAEMDVPDAGE